MGVRIISTVFPGFVGGGGRGGGVAITMGMLGTGIEIGVDDEAGFWGDCVS
jgi:hypothetical protein